MQFNPYGWFYELPHNKWEEIFQTQFGGKFFPNLLLLLLLLKEITIYCYYYFG